MNDIVAFGLNNKEIFLIMLFLFFIFLGVYGILEWYKDYKIDMEKS